MERSSGERSGYALFIMIGKEKGGHHLKFESWRQIKKVVCLIRSLTRIIRKLIKGFTLYNLQR